MFLSNPRTALWTLCLFAALSCSCGSSQTTANNVLGGSPKADSRFPFPLREPETYQADAVLSTNGEEKRFFVARNGDKWRFDIYRGDRLDFSQVKSDKIYEVDHTTKTYREQPAGSDPLMPSVGGERVRGLFEGRDHYIFDDVATDGPVVKYRVSSDDSRGDIFIYFDTDVGMITRQEFLTEDGKPDFVYELRNLKMEVDDSVFTLPLGYKKMDPPTPAKK